MKRGPKYGNILGIKVVSTHLDDLLKKIDIKLTEKEKFYIVTPNPEIVLAATKDWLLRKAIERTDFSIPDGIGLKWAYKYLHNLPLEIIKGRELFEEILKILNKKKMKVYLFGGIDGESLDAVKVLKLKYPDITFSTFNRFPKYLFNGQPDGEENKRLHRKIIGSLKLFEPDFVFVALGCPKQEKWIYRNFYMTKAIGAMAVGGTLNYITGKMVSPPLWMSDNALEWLWRLLQEPKRIVRIWNAVVVFSLKVLITKFLK